MKVAVVAEKPSVAAAIASALASHHRSAARLGSGSPAIHEVDGEFEGRRCVFRVTCVSPV